MTSKPDLKYKDLYSRNRDHISAEENIADFSSIYRLMEEALANGAGWGEGSNLDAIVHFFDKVDDIWDDRLERVVYRKFKIARPEQMSFMVGEATPQTMTEEGKET